MSKQPHVIVTVGTPGTMMKATAPDNYSVEAYGYTADEVADLIATVHNLVRPTEDDDAAEMPSGFYLAQKLAGTLNGMFPGFPMSSSTDLGDPNADAHSVADGLDRCDCGTDTPSPGRIAVRLNGVNHRFPSYGHARDFVDLYGMDHTAVFIRDASDPSLCCFPYVFQLPTGEHMAFETRGMAEVLASVNGIDFEEITYHKDEHRPEHRVDEEQWRARTKVAKASAAAPEQSLCLDQSCRFHGGKHAHGSDELGPTVQFGEDATVTYGPAAGEHRVKCPDPGCQCHTDMSAEEIQAPDVERDEQRAADRADSTRYAVGGLLIPGQRTEASAGEQHPNPCLPGCSCGNGPTPLAADDPTDG